MHVCTTTRITREWLFRCLVAPPCGVTIPLNIADYCKIYLFLVVNSTEINGVEGCWGTVPKYHPIKFHDEVRVHLLSNSRRRDLFFVLAVENFAPQEGLPLFGLLEMWDPNLEPSPTPNKPPGMVWLDRQRRIKLLVAYPPQTYTRKRPKALDPGMLLGRFLSSECKAAD